MAEGSGQKLHSATKIVVFFYLFFGAQEDILRAKKVSNVKRKLISTDISKKIVFGKKLQKMSFLKISATKIGGVVFFISIYISNYAKNQIPRASIKSREIKSL